MLYILLSMVDAVFDGFRAFQTAFKAFQDETNQLFVVKKSKSVDAVNKKLYNSVILLYLTILTFLLAMFPYGNVDKDRQNIPLLTYFMTGTNKYLTVFTVSDNTVTKENYKLCYNCVFFKVQSSDFTIFCVVFTHIL